MKMAIPAFLVCILFSGLSVSAEEKIITSEGRTSSACFTRSQALDLAYTSSSNNAYQICRSLGPDWRYGEIKFQGYVQCHQCGTSDEYKCSVMQQTHKCIKSGVAGSTVNRSVADSLEALAGDSEGASAVQRLERYEEEQQEIKNNPIRIIIPVPNQIVFDRVITVHGDTRGMLQNKRLLIKSNGTQHYVQTDSYQGGYSTQVVLASGQNEIDVCYEERCASVHVKASISSQPLMATLTWYSSADLDLHVTSPDGRRCHYQSKSIGGLCSLDIDNTRGDRPENMSVVTGAPEGDYVFSVVNYSGTPGVRGELRIFKNEVMLDVINFTTTSERNVGVEYKVKK